MSRELAPRSSKKWLSADTLSTRKISASASARVSSVVVDGATYVCWGSPLYRFRGAGRFLRSALSLEVIGMTSSCSR